MATAIILFSDSARGIYIPQHFAESHSPDAWDFSQCTYDDNLAVLLGDPTGEEYDEAWLDVLDNAFYVDDEGNRFVLHQDGDLFAVCDDLMTDEEFENFYGEARDS